MYSNDILYDIIAQQTKSIYSIIELLDWEEEKIDEIQGVVSDGSLNISGDSSVRRTCSLTMNVKEGMESITDPNNLISMNKKIKIKLGVSNNLPQYQEMGDVVWFNLGIFILTSANMNRSLSGNSLSITAQDKMALLTGDIGGIIEGMLEVNRVAVIDDEGNESLSMLSIPEIIYYAVAGLGGEDRSKIIINDVPTEIKTPMMWYGENPLYLRADNTTTTNPAEAVRTIEQNEYAGYILEPFYYPGEFYKQPGDTVASILDDIKNMLGNYEYFYDTEGNFVFQEVKNYLNTSFTPIDKLGNGDYIANFDKAPHVFSFREREIVSTYSNNPIWSNIKNDFIVWGMANETKGPVMYHLAVDDKPTFVENDKPWQQYLIEYGDVNPRDPGKYYGELASKFPQIYDAKEEKWKSDPNDWAYYFDMIDTKSAYGRFGIPMIGKRTVAVVDDQVGRLYPPQVPDYILLNADEGGANQEVVEQLNARGQKFLILKNSDFQKHVQAPYSKDAFGVIRELLYQHTTANESINISSLPLYFLDVNQRIEVYDDTSGIQGDYMIKNLSIPLSPSGLMSIGAVKALSRI